LLSVTDLISITLGIIAVIVAIVAVVLEHLHSSEVKRHNLGEKTAMLWNYARDCAQPSFVVDEYYFRRILLDVVAMGAMKSAITNVQEQSLRAAGDAMFRAMQGKLRQDQLAELQGEFARLFQRRPYNHQAIFR
jgi:hypothetical protein